MGCFHSRKREREEVEEIREKAKKEKEWKEEWDVSPHIMNRFHKTLGVSCILQYQLLSLDIRNCCKLHALGLKEPDCS